MRSRVKLSERSQELMEQYLNACRSDLKDLMNCSESIELKQLITLLHDEIITPSCSTIKTNEEIEFILASLRAELLTDLLSSIQKKDVSMKHSEEHSSWANSVKFILLAGAGTLLAACEGFDSMATMLTVLALPAPVILGIGILFSLLSLVVFYGFDLVQVSKNLGIKLTDTPKLLDIYLLQMNEINAIRKKIDTYHLATMSPEELQQLELIISMLEKRFQSVREASKQFDSALNSPTIQIVKEVFSAAAGLLFFGSGFFAGQSVALYILGLFVTAANPTFWPVILFGVVVGAAAFSLYWYVQRVGVKQLISGWFGLDEEKIALLCDESKLAQNESKLLNLKEKIKSTRELVTQVSEQQEKPADPAFDTTESHVRADSTASEVSELRRSNNIYSFHSKAENADVTNHPPDETENYEASACSHG